MKRILLIALVLCSLVPGEAQIGRVLKDRAKSALNNPTLRQKAKEKIGDQMEQIRSEYDSSSFNYAVALSDNAGLFESKERHERHQKLMMSYFQKKTNSKSPLDDARDRVDRAEILYANGKYYLAALFLAEATAIYIDEGATNTVPYAKAIANGSLVAHSLGRLTLAERLGEHSLELRENLLGKDSKGYAASINNYALLQRDLGKYNEAEKLIAEAIERNGQLLGKESMGYAIALNNEASLKQTLGRYEEAEKIFKEAISIAEVHLKEKSGNFQQLQTNLALLYQDMGRYEEAEAIYQEAIAIKEQRLGVKHPDYAHLLNLLASLYVDMGKDDEVEELLKKSISIHTLKGANSPKTISVKNDLANFYRYKGRFDEAFPIMQQVVSARRDQLGVKHPSTVQSIEDLAIVQWKLGNIEKARTLYREVMRSSLNEINTYFLPMSEGEKAKYWSKMRPRFQRFYAFATDAGEEDPTLLVAVYNLQLATKALLLNSGTKIKNAIMNGSDEELKQKYTDWLDQKESLSTYYTYSKAELQEENINIDSLERAANASEKYLSENSNVFNEGLKLTDIRYADIIKSLDDGEVILDIIHTTRFDNRLTDHSIYIALAVDKNSETPRMTVLENGDDLEGKFYKYYNNVIHNKLEDKISYDNYWKPLESLVAGKKRVYVSLDGIYNQISINTLRKPGGDFLVNNYNITQLSNSRDIIHFKSTSNTINKKDIFLLGHPIYGGDGSISLLPGTKKEIQNISSILKSKQYSAEVVSDNQATELALKNLGGQHIIHIATHGFFLADLRAREGKVFGIDTERAKDNPLLRSGLMLTGAGNMALGESTADLSGSNNGILTAYETMSLGLEESNLVVLSACETGLGDVVAGEGVYGLQRALLVAGADNLIMSLWKVDDTATQKLMSYFYRYLGESGSISDSFRRAQLQLRKEYSHPYYWGAFVLVSG